MGTKPKIIVIQDSNIWISYLIGSQYGSLIDALDNPDFQFIICKELVDELKDVTKRPKFRKWFTEEAAQAIVDLIEEKCILLPINNIPQPLVRDPKDQYLINLALQGKADFLVSNDDDITSLKDSFSQFEILTLAEFMEYYVEYEKNSKLASIIENNLNNTFTQKPFKVIELSIKQNGNDVLVDSLAFKNNEGKRFCWSRNDKTLDEKGNHLIKDQMFNIHSGELSRIKGIEPEEDSSKGYDPWG